MLTGRDMRAAPRYVRVVVQGPCALLILYLKLGVNILVRLNLYGIGKTFSLPAMFAIRESRIQREIINNYLTGGNALTLLKNMIHNFITNLMRQKNRPDTTHYIDKMMEMAGYNTRSHHLKQMGNYPWWHEFTWTRKEEQAFKDWFVDQKYVKKFGKKRALMTYGWFSLAYGLRTID
jgi:hypothetical protein